MLTFLGSDLFSSMSASRRMLADCSQGREAVEACFPLKEEKNETQSWVRQSASL